MKFHSSGSDLQENPCLNRLLIDRLLLSSGFFFHRWPVASEDGERISKKADPIGQEIGGLMQIWFPFSVHIR